jgi:hypothetical protein
MKRKFYVLHNNVWKQVDENSILETDIVKVVEFDERRYSSGFNSLREYNFLLLQLGNG